MLVYVSLVGSMYACYVTLSGNLMYESCRKGVCVQLALQVS